MNCSTLDALLAAALLAAASVAWAHGDNSRDPARSGIRPMSMEDHPFGRQGEPAAASRTVAISMSDAMRYDPREIRVRQGETVRFVVTNRGKMLHELVIGTMEGLREHGEQMKKHPGMEHDEPYMAHVAPGKTSEITWTFTKLGEFHFGCLVPGHFDAGMVGRIVVAPR